MRARWLIIIIIGRLSHGVRMLSYCTMLVLMTLIMLLACVITDLYVCKLILIVAINGSSDSILSGSCRVSLFIGIDELMLSWIMLVIIMLSEAATAHLDASAIEDNFISASSFSLFLGLLWLTHFITLESSSMYTLVWAHKKLFTSIWGDSSLC